MKKHIVLFFTLIFALNCTSQISFEKGYYIDNSNRKVEGLIKNKGWLNNPTEFKFKISENSEEQLLTIKSVKEFGFLNRLKYLRYNVNIDRSSDILDEVNNIKKPIFNKEELFLKVLVEGKANLYLFEDKGLVRFFFSKDNNDVEQLVYKRYLNSDYQVAKNNAFKQQLWINLRCQNTSIRSVENLNYKIGELLSFFVKYNECNNAEFTNFEKKEKKDLFNLTLRPGIKSSSFLMRNEQYVIWNEIDFGNKFGFRFGIEAEFILPFNNNKWSLLIEPNYQYFKSEKTFVSNKTTGDKIIADVNYKSIEIPLSLRYYIFLNDKSKIFINTSLIYDYSFNSSLELTRPDGDIYKSMDVSTGIDYAIGMGYKYNDKYSLELRYQMGRDIISSYGSWHSELNSLSMVFGYTLF